MNTPEKFLVDEVCRYFVAKNYKVLREVWLWSCTPDIIVYKNNSLGIVEAKVNAVSRVLVQARNHLYHVDFVCVAWGSKIVSEKLFHECNRDGIGILHSPPPYKECKKILSPKPSSDLWYPSRNQFLKLLQNKYFTK